MANMKIRLAARGAGVPLWRIAKEMGISEPTITRMLRNELSETDQARVLAVIERLGMNSLLHEQATGKHTAVQCSKNVQDAGG